MFKNIFLKLFVITVAIFFFSACGDNGTDAIEEDPPALPNLEYSQPDVSYFENTTVQPKSSSNNFLAARNIALSFSGLSNIGNIYGSLISSAPEEEVSFNDGVWEWSYGYSFEGISSEVRITARETSNNVTWVVYVSYDDGQGTSIEDYKYMEGTTQNDGLMGGWTFYSPELNTETPVPYLEANWETDGDTESDIAIEIMGEDGSSGNILINYGKSGNEFLMEIQPADESGDSDIFWNPEDGYGYIIQGNEEPLCWDSSSEPVVDVSCSELGL